MLHRSFKPAKCKTSLKLSVSRIKLLKNKKASQVLQLKRELAKLLESGQDQTARIRVEHLVREEKTIAAYDLIEIYCELIAARLPIIESQKNCPIDLKEAITSVIFASPRCSEILELLDVRKQFTAKYGKEFISSVVELRPECGVNRSLVEKLSAIAPDGKTKIKILSAIAEEHNIQWVPTSFGEKQPITPEDLLNGPNTLEKSSKMHAETLPARDQKHVVPADLNTQNERSSASIQHDASAEHDSNGMKSPSNFHLFRSGVGSEEMEFRRESSGERNEFYVNRKDWNMQFKDATSAAQAAAESAERASMAARAAAELSNQERTVRQYSRESQKSSVASKLSAEHRLKDPSNSFSHCNNPRIYNEKANEDEKDNMGGVVQESSRDDGNTRRYSGVASFKSNATSTVEDLSLHNFQKAVRYPPRNDYEEEYMKFEKGNFFEVSRKEHDSKFVGSNFTHDLPEDLSNSFSDGENPWLHTERTNGKEKDNMGRAAEAPPRDDDNTNGYSGIASFKSYEVSIDEDLLANSFQNAGRYPHMNDFEVESMKPEKGNSFDEGGRKEQASEFVVRLQDGLETENVDYIAESRCAKQSSTVSTSGNVDGESSNYQEHGNGDRYKGFFVDVHQTDLRAKTEPSNSRDTVAAVFDDSASDEDEHRFNLGHDHIEQKTYFPSPNRKSQRQNSVNPKAWSLTRDENELAFSHFTTESYHISQLPESRNKPSVTIESEDIAAVTFDESDGPSSESEVEADKPKLIERMDEKRLLPRQTTYAAKSSDSSLSWSHHGVAASSLKETDHTVSVDKFGHSDSLSSRPSSRHPNPQLEYTDEAKHPHTLQKSRISFTGGLEDNAAHPEMSHDAAQDIEISDGERKYLNFGTLVGGLRNKGYKHPPYVKNPSNKASSSQLMFKDDLISSADSTNPEVIIQEPIDKERRPKVNMKDTSDSSDEEFPQKPLSSNLGPSKQEVGMKEDKTSRGRAAPITYFDSDGDDSEYNFGPSSTNKNRSGSGISQRTKVSPPDSRRSSYPNVKAGDEADYGSERKASLRRSMATETRPKHHPNDTSSSHWGSSKPIPKSKFSLHTDGSKAPGKEQTSSRETPLKEGSTKASHVHPKLPDFDTISAQLASIRLNRKY